MTIILHRHFRDLGYCNRGMREFCQREKIDWSAFVQNGIDAERLRALNNAMIERAIVHAERAGNGQR